MREEQCHEIQEKMTKYMEIFHSIKTTIEQEHFDNLKVNLFKFKFHTTLKLLEVNANTTKLATGMYCIVYNGMIAGYFGLTFN